MDIQEQAQDDN